MSSSPVAETPSRSDDAEALNLGWSLAMLLRSWQSHAEEALADIPHGTRGFHVLCAVAAGEAPTQVALAASLAIDRTVMTYLLDDLEQAGLVERRADPRDRRARRIVPTARGRRTLTQARRRIQVVDDAVLGGLAEADRSRLATLAGGAARAVQRAEPGTDPCVAVESVLTSS